MLQLTLFDCVDRCPCKTRGERRNLATKVVVLRSMIEDVEKQQAQLALEADDLQEELERAITKLEEFDGDHKYDRVGP